MSRILRRPMFRGGRVDSRGTGITSGLSYKQGGRVGFKTGGSYWDRIKEANSLFFDNPDAPFTADTRKTFLGMDVPGTGMAVDEFGKPVVIPKRNFAEDMSWLVGPGKFLKAGGGGLNLIRQMGKYPKFPPGYRSGKGDKYVDPKLLSNEWYMSKIRPYLSGAKETLSGAGSKIKEFGTTGTIGSGLGIWGLAELYDAWKNNRDALQVKKEETGDPEIDPQIAALNDQIAELEKLLLEQAKVKKSKTLSKEEKIAKIKENEAMFREVYGSGRGEDATAMLLNFAGKALKPGADTKSAFGEFFEEEGKRPSERKKYKDAAAQAAIQSFLAGETSFKKFEDELGVYGKKLEMQTAATNAAKKNQSYAELWAASREPSTTKKNKSVANQWLDNQNINKFVNETNSKKVPTEELFVKENIGEYFVDQQTGEFFLIDVLENGEIGKVRKG